MILAVIGSKRITSEKLTWKTLEAAIEEIGELPQTIIHSGRKGIETYAGNYARVKNIAVDIQPVDYKSNPGSEREAFFANSLNIFQRADTVLIIWDGSCAVTGDLVRCAFRSGRSTYIYSQIGAGKTKRLSLLQVGKILGEIDQRRVAHAQRKQFDRQ